MRCLVTGASSHVGSALVRTLVARGHDVTALLRPESDPLRLGYPRDGVEVRLCDLADPEGLASVVDASRPEAVFHLAWAGTVAPDRDHPGLITANIVGSARVIEAAVQSGCTCVIGVGSQAEYAPLDSPLSDATPEHPDTTYGATKLAVCRLAAHLCAKANTRFAWIRLVAAYGPRDEPRHLIPSVVSKLLAGEEPALTSGHQRWDYLYVDDAAEALALVAESSAAGTYVLGSGEARTVREIVQRIRDAIDPSLPLGFGRLPDPTRKLLLADSSRLQAETGWSPRTSLAAGLDRTIEWHRERLDESRP